MVLSAPLAGSTASMAFEGFFYSMLGKGGEGRSFAFSPWSSKVNFFDFELAGRLSR